MKKVNFIQFAITMLIACCGFSSCISTKKYFTVSLKSVESPTNAQQQFGETKVVTFTEGSLNKYKYEDEYISIIWYVTSTKFCFDLTNKSGHSLKINWDDISYVDYNGQVGRVMHSGVKYNERNNSQPATSIPKGASLSDVLLPTDNVTFVSGKYGGWIERALIPCNSDNDINHYNGKTLAIMMPIYIEGVQNDYVFTFKIEKLLEETVE